MTPEEIRLVRSSWSMIAERSDAFTARFYDHLFVIDAGAADLFNGVNMTIQRWKLAQTLGVVVQALDDLDALLPAVAALGRRHTRYGVLHHHFDSVGAALLQAFVDTLGQQFTPAVRAAWVRAYSLVATEMQKGLGNAPPPLRLDGRDAATG
ncbi:MAG TPA: globin domain-containing protein [Gemmatimonadaceae bacterium]|jgi:hemoglobin-like flavoprotein|nr:globin domain-containing protein [Gemmatimonadaceae bacterium]